MSKPGFHISPFLAVNPDIRSRRKSGVRSNPYNRVVFIFFARKSHTFCNYILGHHLFFFVGYFCYVPDPPMSHQPAAYAFHSLLSYYFNHLRYASRTFRSRFSTRFPPRFFSPFFLDFLYLRERYRRFSPGGLRFSTSSSSKVFSERLRIIPCFYPLPISIAKLVPLFTILRLRISTPPFIRHSNCALCKPTHKMYS